MLNVPADYEIVIKPTKGWFKLNFARDSGYLDAAKFTELLHASEEIGRLLGGILAKPESFCASS